MAALGSAYKFVNQNINCMTIFCQRLAGWHLKKKSTTELCTIIEFCLTLDDKDLSEHIQSEFQFVNQKKKSDKKIFFSTKKKLGWQKKIFF